MCEKKEFPSFQNGGKIVVPVNANDTKILKETYFEIIKEGRAQVITNINHKGGVGKTTITLNLSATLAFFGFRVLVVDLDPQANTTKAFRVIKTDENTGKIIPPKKTILDLLLIENKLDSGVVNDFREAVQKIDFEGISLDILPSDIRLADDFDSISKMPYKETFLYDLLEHIKGEYDFIIVDNPPRVDLPLQLSLMASDFINIVADTDPFSEDGLLDLFKPIKNISPVYKRIRGGGSSELKILGVIFTKYEKNVKLSNVILESITQAVKELTQGRAENYESTISKSTAIPTSQLINGSVLFSDPFSKSSFEFLELTNEMIKKIIEKY